MTRIFLDDWETNATNLLQTDAGVTGPQLRGLLIDLKDSLKQDEAAIVVTTDKPLTTTASFVAITGYDGEVGDDGVFLKTDTAGGIIETATTAGFTYDLKVQLSFEVDNNADYEFAILVDGSPTGFIGSITGSGNDDLQSISLDSIVLSASSDSQVQIGLRSLAGGDDITIKRAVLITIIQPTNGP